MKRIHLLICLPMVLLAGCKQDLDHGAARCREMPGGVLLTTELPPELLEGTAQPVILPPRTPMPSGVN